MYVDNYDNINDTNTIINNKKLNQIASIIFIQIVINKRNHIYNYKYIYMRGPDVRMCVFWRRDLTSSISYKSPNITNPWLQKKSTEVDV